MRARAFRATLALLVSSGVVLACNAILGNEERRADPGDLSDLPSRDGSSGGTNETLEAGKANPPPCSTDLQNDQKNCGVCGHDCLGGTCSAGKCQPFTIVTGQTQPSYLVVEKGVAFWTNQVGTVHRCEVTGCNGAPKYLTGIDAGNETPAGLTVLGNDLYVLGYYSAAIDRCPITGCTLPARIASNLDYPNGLERDASGVFVMSANGGWVARCTVPDCAGGPQRIATRTTAGEVWQTFASNDTDLFWVGGPNNAFTSAFIYRAPKSQVNGAPIEVAKAVRNPFTLHATKGFLYVIENGTSVYRIATTPGAARTTFTTSESGAFGLVADEKNLYWLTDTTGKPPGSIRRCPLAGCANGAETLVSNQSSPRSLVVTDNALYWTEFGGGTVKGVAK